MTTNDKRKKRLLEELKNSKEERDAYVSSGVDVGVAFQIRALREQRKWNQTKLAEEAKMQQERISVLENPSHSPTLATLKKLANAFDVGLIVRFAPISELVKYELDLHSKSLEVPSFDQEDYFKEKSRPDVDLYNIGLERDRDRDRKLIQQYSERNLYLQFGKTTVSVTCGHYCDKSQEHIVEKENTMILDKISEGGK